MEDIRYSLMTKTDKQNPQAFVVFTPGFDVTSVIVAALSRSQAKFLVAYSIHENYFGGSVPMGTCFGYIKSIKRAHEYDELAKIKTEVPSYIKVPQNE